MGFPALLGLGTGILAFAFPCPSRAWTPRWKALIPDKQLMNIIGNKTAQRGSSDQPPNLHIILPWWKNRFIFYCYQRYDNKTVCPSRDQ